MNLRVKSYDNNMVCAKAGQVPAASAGHLLLRFALEWLRHFTPKLHYTANAPWLNVRRSRKEYMKHNDIEVIELGGELPILRLGKNRLDLHEIQDSQDKNYYLNCAYLTEPLDGKIFSDFCEINRKCFPESICLWFDYKNPHFSNVSGLLFSKNKNTDCIKVCLLFDPLSWDGELSLIHIARALPSSILSKNIVAIEEPREVESYIESAFVVTLNDSDKVDGVIENLCKELASIKKNLVESYAGMTGVVSKINVPNQQKYIFNQYLAYFGQYLSDLGVESQISLTAKDESLFLTVKPIDMSIDVKNVYTALGSYLTLPDDLSIVFPSIDPYANVKYEQLISQVRHLKAQLDLTRSLVATKDQYINLLHQTKVSVMKNNETSWEPVDGVKIKKYTGKFFEIDIPKLLEKIGIKNKK